jgi:methionyl-tRNA synthetase
MSDKKPHYITTTLPYVNSDPHIGFAYEIVAADALTRFWRSQGTEVFFNTGTDEHGQKIAQKADESGQSRQEYVDHYAEEFQKLADPVTGLNLSYHDGGNFIRTTNEAHKAAAQEMWRRCAAQGDIYKKKYSGLYCVGCELFYKADELDEKQCCKIHGKPVLEVEEENYFFKLSNYQAYLEEYLSTEAVIEPEWRRQEAITFVKNGLEDFSISREKARLNWGVPVPDNEGQVMYVWFDALTNYISTLGWPQTEGDFAKFWTEGEVIQLAGKDQVRFQSVMWQAMLKSLGNVISPYELIARYGTDATRYLLLRHVHPFDDSDVTWEKLDEWYTAGLVNGLGNLVSRVMKMAETHLPEPYLVKDQPVEASFTTLMSKFELSQALDLIFAHIQKGDEYIQTTEPFKKIKSTDPAVQSEALGVIGKLVQHVYTLTLYLEPLMPHTAVSIREAVRANKKPDNLFPRLEVK